MRNGEPGRLFEFGPFCVDTRERMLTRNGLQVPVTPKVFEILLALVENRGHTVGKDELIDRVWPDAFVEVGNLNRNISTLRGLLGDDTNEPRFIKTFPKLGYRFDADVLEILEDDDSPIVEKRHNHHPETTQATPSSSIFGRRMIAIVLVLAVGICIASLGWAYTTRNGSESRGSSEARTATSNTEAFELYQKGRILWQDRSGESLHQATMLLEQAATSEPNFALAHAALADAYAFDGQDHTKAVDTASKAIQLDPSLGEPHATIGFVKMFWEWKFTEADSHFKQAITLSPNYATGHQWYSINLIATGQGHAALAEMKRALELEPDSLAINADMCQMLYFNRRLDEAEAQCKKTLEMDAKFLNASLYLYDIYMEKGKYDDAVDQFFRNEEMVAYYSAFPGQIVDLKKAYQTGGIRAFWRKRIEMLQKMPFTDYAIARYQARLGERDEMFQTLRKAYEKHDLNFVYFLAEPLFFICCYSDPRYTELQILLIGH